MHAAHTCTCTAACIHYTFTMPTETYLGTQHSSFFLSLNFSSLSLFHFLPTFLSLSLSHTHCHKHELTLGHKHKHTHKLFLVVDYDTSLRVQLVFFFFFLSVYLKINTYAFKRPKHKHRGFFQERPETARAHAPDLRRPTAVKCMHALL